MPALLAVSRPRLHRPNAALGRHLNGPRDILLFLRAFFNAMACRMVFSIRHSRAVVEFVRCRAVRSSPVAKAVQSPCQPKHARGVVGR